MPHLRPRLEALLAPRYTVSGVLAIGGMGRVYAGHDPVLDRDVAIKLLPPERATAVAVERFLRETRILAQLNHPHIVPILEARHDGELLWFVMPLLAGNTLAHHVARAPLGAAAVRRVGMDILDALAHAHAHAVIHRDVKPSNIFMHDGHAVLADFGVAALAADSEATLTGGGDVVGTLRYMSPEQIRGGPATARSDIYSVGATLFEAATGTPWSGDDATAWRAVPRALRKPLRKALSPRPDDRWRDAAEFRAGLADARDSASRWIAAGVVAGSVTATILFVALQPSSPETFRPARRGIVLLPFVDRDSIAPMLAAVATGELEWFPPVDAVPWQDALALTDVDARKVAAFQVSGTVVANVGGIGTARITVRDSNGTVAHEFVVPGRLDDVPAWGHDIADSVIGQLRPAEVAEFRQFGRVSRNMQALQEFYAGEARFLQGDGAGAEQRYRNAWTIDPGFVRARWAQLLARQWQRLDHRTELVELATLGERIPEPLRSVVRLQLEPDLAARISGFEALSVQYPKYTLIRQLRANELFSRGPLVGRALQEGVDSLRAVAVSLPTAHRVDALTHIAWGAIRLGDRELADSAIRARAATVVADDGYGDFLRLVRAGRFQRWIAVPLRVLALRTASRDGLQRVTRLGLQFDIPFDQLDISRTIGSSSPDPGVKASMLSAQAVALLALGRPSAAIAVLDSAAIIDPANSDLRLQVAEWEIALPAAGIAADAPARHAGVLEELAAVRPARVAWIRAIDAMRRGDRASLARQQAELERLGGNDLLAREFAAYARALLTAGSDPDGALALTAQIRRDSDDRYSIARGAFTRSLIHLWRSEWHLAAGRPAESLGELLWHENNDLRGWPDGAPQEGEMDAALAGIARVRRAEALVGAGQLEPACRLARRVAELWRDAESSHDSWRARAAAVVTRCA